MIVVTNPREMLIKNLVAVYITQSQLETAINTGSVYVNAVVRQGKIVTELGSVNHTVSDDPSDNQIITICLDKLSYMQVDAIAKLGVAIAYSGDINRGDSLLRLTNNDSIAIIHGANKYYDKYRLAFINTKVVVLQQVVKEIIEDYRIIEDYSKLDLHYSYSDDPKVYRSGEDVMLEFYSKYYEKGVNLIAIKTILHAAELGIANSLNEHNEHICVVDYIRKIEASKR